MPLALLYWTALYWTALYWTAQSGLSQAVGPFLAALKFQAGNDMLSTRSQAANFCRNKLFF